MCYRPRTPPAAGPPRTRRLRRPLGGRDPHRSPRSCSARRGFGRGSRRAPGSSPAVSASARPRRGSSAGGSPVDLRRLGRRLEFLEQAGDGAVLLGDELGAEVVEDRRLRDHSEALPGWESTKPASERAACTNAGSAPSTLGSSSPSASAFAPGSTVIAEPPWRHARARHAGSRSASSTAARSARRRRTRGARRLRSWDAARLHVETYLTPRIGHIPLRSLTTTAIKGGVRRPARPWKGPGGWRPVGEDRAQHPPNVVTGAERREEGDAAAHPGEPRRLVCTALPLPHLSRCGPPTSYGRSSR